MQDRPTVSAHRARSELAGMLPLGGVSELVGVPAATIRSWEQRDGLAVGRLNTHSERRYSDVDLAALRRMRDEIAAGRTSAEAAALVNAALSASVTELCSALLLAVHRYDPASVVEVLDRGLGLHGLGSTVDDVLFPALREVGNRWAQRTSDVAQEHLASTTIQGWLRAQHQRQTRMLPPGSVVVLGCGPEEHHTLGLDALAALLAQEGLTSLNLGADTPAASLKLAVELVKPSAVVVACHTVSGRASTNNALRALSETAPHLYYAGAAFRTQASRQTVPGTYLGSNLTRAASLLATQVEKVAQPDGPT
jgi:methanogenic corrinoid protein MtbC1